MRRILLDTNIYGLIADKKEAEEFKNLINKSNSIVYGCSIVRKELRDVPKTNTILTNQGVRNLRNFLLTLYDSITKDHSIIINEKTNMLAEKYLAYFIQITGKTAIEHLKNDFLLIACASIHKLDLVISNDNKTLLSIDAVRAYNFINIQEELSEMRIITYEEIKTLLKRWLPL